MKRKNNCSGPCAGHMVTLPCAGRVITLLFLVFFTAAHAATDRIARNPDTYSPADTAGILFSRVFAPQEGLTKPVEKPWRQEICLNGNWQFQPAPLPADYDIKNGAPKLPAPVDGAWSATPIRIPSPWNVNAFSYSGGKTFPSYPAEWEKARMGWLKRNFTVPAGWKDKRLILHFEAVCGSAQVFVNGEQVAEHFDNSLPFEVDITDFVERDGENTLLVGVRQASLFDVQGLFGRHTYPSGSPWTRQMIGIWQDVYLLALPPVHVDGIAVRPLLDQGMLEFEVTVRNSTGTTQAFQLGGDILPWLSQAGTDRLSAPEPGWSLGRPVASVKRMEGKVGPWMTTTILLRRPVGNELKYWTPESPNLYALVLDLLQDGKTADRSYQRFGWRQWGIRGRDVTLNGKPYKLLGESGHLLGIPYMTRRYAWSWYKALKDLHANAIRLHANLRPRFYLELADEMGIAILDESEIYASTMEINYYAPETWQRFHDHIDGMVLRDRNYPCVFGWSIANEILSAIWWKGIPRKFWPPVIDKVVALADRIKTLDPTRPWISSDGDGDFHGRLPTYIYHYGTPQDWLRQAPKDKPFGIGEGGSMIWGSPAVFSAYNGERSYEGRTGMQEGIAIETYWYLAEQRKLSAFCSVFTIAGTCFEQLRLGTGDALVFGPFVEGQPGMQPEQMPAGATNFNPGYDPAQPLYKTTPVFEAVRAAYAPGGPAPCPWDHRVKSPPRPAPPAPTIKNIAFIGSDQGNLKKALESSGFLADTKTNSPLLVVDGATLDAKRLAEARLRIQVTLKDHGTVFVWASPKNLASINELLPAALSLIPVTSSSLTADRKAPETASLALADLYFQDQSDGTILSYGLAGPLVQQSHQLMEANLSGRRGSKNRGDEKMAAFISTETGGGRLLVTSLTPDVNSARRLKLMRGIFAGLGVVAGPPSDKYNKGFDGAGFLNQALLLGSFQGARYPKILDIDFIGNEAQADPMPEERVGSHAGEWENGPSTGRVWTKTMAAGNGLFDFFGIGIPGTEGSRVRSQGAVLKPEALDANNYLEVTERVSGTNPGTNSVVYVSFWVNAPRAVDASQLRMQMRSDDGAKVWVNSRPVFEERRVYGPGMTDPKPVPMALNGGWNHVLVKIGQLDGPWIFAAKFESTEPGLAEALRASATRPESAIRPDSTEKISVVFPVRISADKRYLEDQQGKPFPILGRTAWCLISQPASAQQSFLGHTQSFGYNSIEISAICHWRMGNHAPFSGKGELPFLKRLDGTDWKDSLDYRAGQRSPDFNTPNEAYWKELDELIARCEKQGILVFFFPAYIGYHNGDQGWMEEMTANGDKKMQAYGAWVAARYKNSRNLVWMLLGDDGKLAPEKNAVEAAFIAGLKSVASQQSVYYSAESSSGENSADNPSFGKEMTLNGIYNWEGGLASQARLAYARQPVMPSYLLEEPYDEEGPDGNNYNPHAIQPVRRFQWWAWLGSIGGYIAGNGYIWPFIDPVWQQHLNTAGANDMKRLNAFIKDIKWWELVPSGLNGMKELVVSRGGKDTAADYEAAACNRDGSLLVAYIPPKHGKTIVIDVSVLSHPSTASWFDPTSGNYDPIPAPVLPEKGRQEFIIPGKNSAGGDDWVLLIRRPL